MIATIADPLSDAMLAIAALYVSFQALRGYRRERKAATEHDPDEKKSLLEDAQTLYASASLSLPWVLWFIFSVRPSRQCCWSANSPASRLAG